MHTPQKLCVTISISDYFRRHIAKHALHRIRDEKAILGAGGVLEVAQNAMALRVDKDIVWPDVGMNDVVFMKETDGENLRKMVGVRYEQISVEYLPFPQRYRRVAFRPLSHIVERDPYMDKKAERKR